ncbi:MAG: aminotransferase class V-fold PLP-dependent enzyme [Actinobacteria bacterium]|nr:aminotransferase class V-fold PLP-dependent enzyme [Actinomycetota bacterium]
MAVDSPVKDLASIYRSQFSVFEHVTYVNSCSQGALADSVKASFDSYISTLELQGSAWGDWAGYQETMRSLFAKFFQVPTTEIAVTTSASAGVSAVASALDFTKGRNKIITTENEFPTIGQTWHAQELRGAVVHHIPSNPDLTVNVAAMIDAIDDQTLIVSITHGCYHNGAVTELEPIIEAAHKKGALVLVDAYQTAGAVPLNLSTLKADFVVGGTLKYLLGVPGVGFLYARNETTSHLIPTSTGWFAAQDIFAMEIHSYDPAKEARRFESGTPAIPSLYPSSTGLSMVIDIGIENIYAYVSQIHDALRTGIESLGGVVITPKNKANHGAMLAVASLDESAHVAALEGEKIVTSSRGGNIRVSPHFYNNFEDVEKIVAAFAKTSQYLRK